MDLIKGTDHTLAAMERVTAAMDKVERNIASISEEMPGRGLEIIEESFKQLKKLRQDLKPIHKWVSVHARHNNMLLIKSFGKDSSETSRKARLKFNLSKVYSTLDEQEKTLKKFRKVLKKGR